MSDKEMKDIWMNANERDSISFDTAQLQLNLKGKMKRLDRVLFFRDAREIIAALFVIVAFGCKAYMEQVTITKVSNILISIWGIYVIYRLMDIRKYKKIIDISHSIKAQLVQQKGYLQQQAQLLDSALVWYVLPPAVLAMVSRFGLWYSELIDWSSILRSLIFISLISWGIYALNKRAARVIYLPLIKNIDQVLIQLDEDSI